MLLYERDGTRKEVHRLLPRVAALGLLRGLGEVAEELVRAAGAPGKLELSCELAGMLIHSLPVRKLHGLGDACVHSCAITGRKPREHDIPRERVVEAMVAISALHRLDDARSLGFVQKPRKTIASTGHASRHQIVRELVSDAGGGGKEHAALGAQAVHPPPHDLT
jgi:hypothetical protein